MSQQAEKATTGYQQQLWWLDAFVHLAGSLRLTFFAGLGELRWLVIWAGHQADAADFGDDDCRRKEIPFYC